MIEKNTMRTHTLSRCAALLLLYLAPGLAGSYRFGAVWSNFVSCACGFAPGERRERETASDDAGKQSTDERDGQGILIVLAPVGGHRALHVVL